VFVVRRLEVDRARYSEFSRLSFKGFHEAADIRPQHDMITVELQHFVELPSRLGRSSFKRFHQPSDVRAHNDLLTINGHHFFRLLTDWRQVLADHV
jgi:hypothetical protein